MMLWDDVSMMLWDGDVSMMMILATPPRVRNIFQEPLP